MGRVAGRLSLHESGKEAGAALPEKLVVRSLEALIPPAGSPPPRLSWECPVDAQGAWTCALPVATYDLAIGAPGYVAQLRQGVAVREGETVALGAFALERSQAISGLLAVEVGRLEPERCLLRVLPEPGRPHPGRVYQGDPRLLERRLSRDGTFTIAPVTAGFAALEVSCPGFVLLHVDDVKVVAGKDTRLRKPLLLRRPFEVAVEVRPPLDPEGGPWTVLVDRRALGPSFVRRPVLRHSGPTDPAGRFVVPKLAPGLSRVQVRDGKGVRRALKEVRIETAADALVRIDLRTIHVEGSLTYRGAPVTAHLSWSDDVAGGPIRMGSNRWGRFAGGLPRAGHWHLLVDAPKLSRRWIPLQVEVKADDSGRAELAIRIPETSLRGRVLDEDGRPAEDAVVSLYGVGDERTAPTKDRGRFEIRFVGAGPWAVAARREAAQGTRAAVSPLVEVTVREGSNPAPVELRMGALRRAAGRVTAAGKPVAGAEVQAEVGTGIPVRGTSQKDGLFRLLVPEETGSAGLLVRAPGGTLHSFDAHLGERALDLELPEEEGTLAIDLPGSWGAVAEKGELLDLYQEGNLVPFDFLTILAIRSGYALSPAAVAFTVPRLAPGAYRVCIGPQGPLHRIDPAAYRGSKVECDEGRLEPGEELRLKPVP
jgi:hypothetical protein